MHCPPTQVSEDMPILPSENLKCYGDLIWFMAAVLRIQISQLPLTVTDKVYDIVQKDVSTAIALPIPGVLLQHTKEPWLKLTSTPVSSRRLDHMYWVQQEGVEFLLAHPKPNSVVVSFTSKSQKHHSNPSDKEGKEIDATGMRFYSTGAL